MGKPTDDELQAALAEAARMREHDEDPHHLAKALLNYHYRFAYLLKLAAAAEHYLHAGLGAREHSELVRAIEAYKEADALSSARHPPVNWLE